MQTIKIAKIDPSAFLPTRKHPVDAGLDIYANCNIVIEPHSTSIVSTGITWTYTPIAISLLNLIRHQLSAPALRWK